MGDYIIIITIIIITIILYYIILLYFIILKLLYYYLVCYIILYSILLYYIICGAFTTFHGIGLQKPSSVLTRPFIQCGLPSYKLVYKPLEISTTKHSKASYQPTCLFYPILQFQHCTSFWPCHISSRSFSVFQRCGSRPLIPNISPSPTSST